MLMGRDIECISRDIARLSRRPSRVTPNADANSSGPSFPASQTPLLNERNQLSLP